MVEIHIPNYVRKYSQLELMKLSFEKLVRKGRVNSVAFKFQEILKRPELKFSEERRYDVNMSNKAFKRQWYWQGKSLEGLKLLKRSFVLTARPGPGPLVKMQKHLNRERNIPRHIRLKEEKKPTRHRRRKQVFVPGPVIPPPGPLDFSRLASTMRNPEFRAVAISRGCGLKGPEEFLRIIGGKTYGYEYRKDPPPDMEVPLSKYWYFYRKFGRWKPSEHHPYSDEKLVLRPDLRAGAVLQSYRHWGNPGSRDV